MQTDADADAAIRCVTTHSPVAMAVLTRCVLTARRPVWQSLTIAAIGAELWRVAKNHAHSREPAPGLVPE
jgi:hypothetical protein